MRCYLKMSISGYLERGLKTNAQSGRVNTEGEGVPQTESRWEERMLAASSLSRRAFPKNASSLFTKNFSIESSCCEFFASSTCNF